MRCYCTIAERWWKPTSTATHDAAHCATGRARPMSMLGDGGARLIYDDGHRLPSMGPAMDGTALVAAPEGALAD